jgi:hypothetical protein
MKAGRNTTDRQGAALLVVLFIVMAITVLSLGFLSRSDVELACGENMILRMQMDYLAESGLEHARGLLLCPPDPNSGYWTGAERLQIVENSNDYYNVDVNQLPLVDPCDPNVCDYEITSTAYREKGGERVGESILRAQLHIDPNTAYWAGFHRSNN